MKRIVIKIILFIFSITLGYFLLKNNIIREIFYVILVSFILAYMLKPLVDYLSKYGVKRKLASGIVVLVFFGVFIAIGIMFIPKVLKESSNLFKSFDYLQIRISEIYNGVKNNNKFFNLLHNELENKILEYFKGIFMGVFKGIIDASEHIISLAVIPVISYYFLADREIMWRKFLIFIPVKRRSVVEGITKDIDKILSRYVMSQLILCIIVGVLTFIVLMFLKVDFPLILALINAMANIIPYFGPIFGGIPAILIALLTSPSKALYTLICLSIIQQVEGDIISPKVVGDSISMHPLMVIILLIIGGKIGGFIGMVLAVPFGVIIKVIYEDINYYLF
ncbi:AI-2E family transporter [Clostridium hydrogeniformans]|uniref:AI-2E family transporter n=1 Tax=Clostridium hydrogeniformans TaxID=349933 RepID=UPI000485A141|nr:AI-2E family transporter [Clostridium hydrogeniformans]